MLTYIHTLKRIRSGKTNYRRRAAVIIGRHSFATIKVTDQNVSAQVLKPTATGDIVVASVHSRELAKHGWKGSLNNLPACYLTGLLLGKKTLEKGTPKVIVYLGRDKFTSRVAACVRGLVDAGINMPVSEESLPDDDRITGKHIADYAAALKSDQEKYNARFSELLKKGLNPEEYPSHFEQTSSNISGKPFVRKKVAKVKEKEKAAKEKAPKKEKNEKGVKKK
ncbi:MAG: 50S ribosomal protein L18 [Nitrososphaera sp.]|nr:50S ribosomal protein L18 [Nitrososphaera sp.]